MSSAGLGDEMELKGTVMIANAAMAGTKKMPGPGGWCDGSEVD
jgi:hypothetical protein